MNKAIRKALYAKLSGAESVTKLLSSSSAIYFEQATPEAEYPLVIFSRSSGTDAYTFAERAWRDQLWLVKAVDRSTSANVADEIDAAVDALLTDGTLTISGASLMSMRRASDMPPFAETKDGQMYRHAGGLYKISAQ